MQITELAAKLQSLGLSDKEAKVYVAALFLGPSAVQKIAEQADVNRATAYVILDQLCAMGLVSQSTEGKKTVYIAEGPEAIGRFLDRQEQDIELKRAELEALRPELSLNQRADTEDAPVVRFYKGVEGAEAASAYLRKTVQPKSEIYGLSNVDEVEKLAPGKSKSNPQQRLKKKISSRAFYYSTKRVIESDPKLLRQAKMVDQPIMADVSLYTDKASFVTYRGKDSVAVLIENDEIVNTLRQLFEIAWNNTQE